jgi:hypothetical protein
MHRTRAEALDEFLLFVGETGDDAARDVAERVLDTAVETIWLVHPWLDFQSPAPLELTLTVGQRTYALPPYVGRLIPRGLVRNLTRQTTLEALSLEAYQARPTDATGTPTAFTLGGVSGVQAQPDPAGEALEWISTSASDVDVTATLEGDDGAGMWTRGVVTLNGTAPVAAGVWSYLDSASKGMLTPVTERTSSRGTVLLRTAVGGGGEITGPIGGVPVRTLVSLAADESAREHQLFSVDPTPEAADVLAIPIIRRPKRLRAASDPLPADWWPAILEEMLIQWRVNTGEVTDAAQMARPRLAALIHADTARRPPLRGRPWSTIGGRP